MKDFRLLILRHKILLLPFFLLGLLWGIILWDGFVHYQVESTIFFPRPFSSFIPASYPIVENKNFPDISAQGIVIMDAASHVVLYAKNPQIRFSPASTTKIMTALIGLETYDLEKELTTWNIMDTEGSGLGLTSGEQLTFGNLLYAILLPSANDAAYTIAANYPGGRDAFIRKMNEKAWALHLYNTHFVDPAGLEDDGDYSTPEDLIRLASVAMENTTFKRIVRTKTATITTTDKQYQYILESRNKLLGIEGVNGIKTGSTEQAGEVLVTSTTKKGHTIYLVVMKSRDRFADTYLLLHFIWSNLHYLDLHDQYTYLLPD